MATLQATDVQDPFAILKKIYSEGAESGGGRLHQYLREWIAQDATLASKAESLKTGKKDEVAKGADAGDRETILPKLVTALKNVCAGGNLITDDLLRDVDLTPEVGKLRAETIPQEYKATLNQLILHDHFRLELRRLPLPKSVYLFDLELTVTPPERIIKEKIATRKTFHFDAETFALISADGDDPIPLKIRVSTEEKLQLDVSFEYQVPYADKLAREEGIEVRIHSERGVRAVGESLSIKMNVPTRDPNFSFTFPEGYRTDVSWFGYMGTGHPLSNEENVGVRFDGWLLPGHGVSLAWYPPQSRVAPETTEPQVTKG
jgi:hypothetical protein